MRMRNIWSRGDRNRVGLGRAAALGCALAALTMSAACSSGSGAGTGSATGTASATAAAFPVTVTPTNGAVTIAAAPKRIVSLSPTATEDLYAVGAGSQVVAVDADSDYPSGAPVTALSGLTPNIEAIAKYSPDLVLASADVGGLVAGLAKLHVPVLVEPAAANLEAAYTQIEQIGDATGHAAQAGQAVTGMKARIAAAVRQAGAGHKGLSYYWELSANPYYSATSSTFIGQILGLFGLTNIADKADKASDGGYPELSAEYVVTAAPQLAFLADSDATDGGQSAAIVAARPGWSTIPAVKDGELVALNGDLASRWGPRLPELVELIAQAVEKAPAA